MTTPGGNILYPPGFPQLTSGQVQDKSQVRLWCTDDQGAGHIFKTLGIDQLEILPGGATNVRAYGAVGDGATDDTEAFIAAMAAACASGRALYIPAGNYLITSTLQPSTSISIFGDHAHQGGSRIYSNISTGAAILNFNNIQRWSLRNLHIEPSSGSLQNAIGVNATNTAHRWYMSNVSVSRLSTGFYISGQIGTAHNLYATYCTNGFMGSGVNSAYIDLKAENCTYGLDLSNCSEITMQLESYGSISRTINLNGCNNIEFVNARCYESSASMINLMRIGTSATCRHIHFRSSQFTVLSHNLNYHPIYIDDVKDFAFLGCKIDITSNLRGCGIYIATRAKDVVIDVEPSGYYVRASSYSTPPVINILPDPFLAKHDDMFSGAVPGTTNCSITRESSWATPNIRTGNEAIHLAVTSSGLTSSRVIYTLPTRLWSHLKGREVTLGAWVYIPYATKYTVPAYPTTLNLSPQISLYDGLTLTSSVAGDIRPGYWNYVRVTKTLDPAATQLLIYFAPIGTAGAGVTSDGNEYMIVDSVHLVTDSPSDLAIQQSATLPPPIGEAALTTSDAVQTVIYSVPTTNDTCIQVTADIIGVETNDHAEAAGYKLIGTFKNDGGTLTQVGTTTIVHSAENTPQWSSSMGVSGSNVNVRVTGYGTSVIRWYCKVDVITIS